MATGRKGSYGTTYVKATHVSQWQSLMRDFTRAREIKCQAAPLDVTTRSRRMIKDFSTGSNYEGEFDYMGMNGYGEYTFPNGVRYEGSFKDGRMHGKGSLCYATEVGTCVIRGKFHHGIMVERSLLFSDTLEHNEDNWKYCLMPDRRFAVEYDIDLMPAGKSFLTADQPTKEIPPGYYDTGDGFYNPITKVICKYEDLSAITRAPSEREQQWILDNCRIGTETPLGARMDLYERWLEPAWILAPQPPPAAGIKTSTMTSFKRQSIISTSEFDYDKKPAFYDAAKTANLEEFMPKRRFRLAHDNIG
ncbi:MORN repeat-containing protein 5 [Helicoverpa armigera]|uniref:MORN repeat-containing protein 5 n=1 Tax=Helicoverpa armigera TaxID=29058 RepID=UPI0030837C03